MKNKNVLFAVLGIIVLVDTRECVGPELSPTG